MLIWIGLRKTWVEGLNDIKTKRFFFEWIADLESFYPIWKYSQFVRKYTSTHGTKPGGSEVALFWLARWKGELQPHFSLPPRASGQVVMFKQA